MTAVSVSLETLALDSLFGPYGAHASRESQALLAHLDKAGQLDWAAPMESGLPFWHHLIDQDKHAPELLDQVLTRNPALLDQRNREGQTLWTALWAKREACNSRESPSKRDAINASLCVMLAHAAPHHVGLTDEERAPLFNRVMAMNDPRLMEAIQANAPLNMDEARRGELWKNMTLSQWVVARDHVNDLSTPIVLADAVTRPFWRWALERGMASEVLKELASLPATPQHLEMKAWSHLRAQRARPRKGVPMKSKADLMALARALPQSLATLDDLGRPAAWFLIAQNPTLLKDIATAKGTQDLLGRKDQAGHGLAYYLTGTLDHQSLAKQDLRYLQEAAARLDLGFLNPVKSQGLLAQWFADPAGFAYGSRHVLPKWNEASQTGNSLHPRNADIVSHLLLGKGMWAMSEADAALIAKTWARQPQWFTQARNFVLPLWQDKALGRPLHQSPLAPHMPAVICRWLLADLARQQAASTPTSQGPTVHVLSAENQRIWTACLNQPWVIDALDSRQIEQDMLRMGKPENQPTSELMSMAQAFTAKLRSERTPDCLLDRPTVTSRRRARP